MIRNSYAIELREQADRALVSHHALAHAQGSRGELTFPSASTDGFDVIVVPGDGEVTVFTSVDRGVANGQPLLELPRAAVRARLSELPATGSAHRGRQTAHNFVTNDVASHDAILNPHFTCTSTTGAHSNRASYLEEWRTGFDPEVITYWDMRDQRITVIGDVALFRAATQWVRVVMVEPPEVPAGV